MSSSAAGFDRGEVRRVHQHDSRIGPAGGIASRLPQELALHALDAGKRGMLGQIQQQVGDVEVDRRGLVGMARDQLAPVAPSRPMRPASRGRAARHRETRPRRPDRSTARTGRSDACEPRDEALLRGRREDRRHPGEAAVAEREVVGAAQDLEVGEMRGERGERPMGGEIDLEIPQTAAGPSRGSSVATNSSGWSSVGQSARSQSRYHASGTMRNQGTLRPW